MPNAIDFQVDQAAFAAALGAVGRAVATKTTHPILQTIKVEALSDEGGQRVVLSATNLEIGARTTINAAVAVPGAVAIPERILADWVAALPVGTVRLASQPQGSRLGAICGRSKASFALHDAADFPTFAPPDETTAISLDARRFRRALQRVLPAVMQDGGHEALTCVCVAPGADGLRVAALDGHRLAQSALPETAGGDATPLLVPYPAAREFVRLLGEGTVAKLVLSPSGKAATLSVGGSSVTARLVEGAFPQVGQLIPQGHATRVAVEVAELTRALKLASFFGTDGHRYAILDAAPGRLKISSPDAGAGEGESEVEAAFEGQPCIVGANAPFLLELLATASAPVITLAWQSATTAIVMREVTDAGTHQGDLWLVMPVHLASIAAAVPRSETVAAAPAPANPVARAA